MGDYTKLEKTQIKDILSLYDIGDLVQAWPLSLGISNSNYKIQTTQDYYLLKVSNDKSLEQLQEEQNILSTLKEVDYPYSITAIPNKEKSNIYQSKNVFGVIYPFIEGIPPGPSDVTCFQIGQGLGKIHQSTLNQTKLLENLRPHTQVGYGPQEIMSFVAKENCPQDFKDAVYQLFPDRLESFITSNFEKSIIHGDLYYDNTLFHNDNLNAILDFEQGGVGECILDLGISISGTCLEKGNINERLIDSFLKGYQTVRLLPPSEFAIIDDAIALGLISISLWRIKRFTLGDLNPALKYSYRELFYKALNYKKEKGLI